jgi:hypothetical protein
MPEETNNAPDPAPGAETAAEGTVKKLHYIVHVVAETNQIIKVEEFNEDTKVSRELPLPLFLSDEADGELTEEEPDEFVEYEYDWPQHYAPSYPPPHAFFGYPMWPGNAWTGMPAPCVPPRPPRVRVRSTKDAAFPCTKVEDTAFPCSKVGEIAFPCSKVEDFAFACSKVGEVAFACSKVEDAAFACSKVGDITFPCSKAEDFAFACSKVGEVAFACSKLGDATNVSDSASSGSKARRSRSRGTRVRSSGTLGPCLKVKFKPKDE